MKESFRAKLVREVRIAVPAILGFAVGTVAVVLVSKQVKTNSFVMERLDRQAKNQNFLYNRLEDANLIDPK